MEGYDAASYGDRIAAHYDDHYRSRGWKAEVAFLSSLATAGADGPAGPALELGVGTGRIALPLAARGIEVHGVDASAAMVAQLRAKPGGDAIPVTIADFRSFSLGERFALVYVVFNTFFSLCTQDEQVECFATVASHLRDGGRFVLECFVPDLSRFTRNQHTGTTVIETDEVRLDVSVHEPEAQRVRSQHVVIRDGGVDLFPVQIRYAWPSELDLMARLAGLGLEARYADFARAPFTGASGNHVSVYRKGG